MTAELIYKTTSPAAIAWWENASAEANKSAALRVAYIQRMTTEFGGFERFGDVHENRELMRQGIRVAGLASGYYEVPPADSGWRLDAKEKFWAPKLATAAGKARAKELATLTSFDHQKHAPEIGVPSMCFAGMYLYRAGFDFEVETQTLYQTWGSGQCEKECAAAQQKASDVVWVEVPRSEWYARIEAKEAEDAA